MMAVVTTAVTPGPPAAKYDPSGAWVLLEEGDRPGDHFGIGLAGLRRGHRLIVPSNQGDQEHYRQRNGRNGSFPHGTPRDAGLMVKGTRPPLAGLFRFLCQMRVPGVKGDSPIFVHQLFASVPAKIGTVPRWRPFGL